jgi:hypothetical protein
MTFLVRLPLSEYPTNAFAGFGLGEFTLLTARAGAWLAQLAYEDEPAKIISCFAEGERTSLLLPEPIRS